MQQAYDWYDKEFNNLYIRFQYPMTEIEKKNNF